MAVSVEVRPTPAKAMAVSVEARPTPAKVTGVSDKQAAWPTGPGHGAHGQQRHHRLPNFARNLSCSFFETPQKHCNSNDANSMFEQAAGELRAKSMGGGEAWPGFEATHRATSATRPHWCEGRRRDLPRCRWAVAGPGRASRRRAERSSQRGRRAGGPPPTGTHSGRALRRPEHQRGHKHQHATRTARGRAAAHGRTKQPGPAGHTKQPGPQPGNARRSSPSEPCARAGASRPGRSGCGPRCAAPHLRCR